MRLLIVFAFFFALVSWAPLANCFAATVSCVVKEIKGSTLILEDCDERLAKDFKKGGKVKVKQGNRKK